MITKRDIDRLAVKTDVSAERYSDKIKEAARETYGDLVEEVAILRKGLMEAVKEINRLGGNYNYEEFLNYNETLENAKT